MKFENKPTIYDNPEGVNLDRVIFKGRGGKSNNSNGNNDYRYLIQELKPDYERLEKSDKISFTRVIKDTLLGNGYILVEKDGTFIDDDKLDKEFRKKISQALREKDEFIFKTTNIEFVDKMVNQVREKLKSNGIEVSDATTPENNVKRRKVSDVDSESESERSWVDKVAFKIPKKEPRSGFVSSVISSDDAKPDSHISNYEVFEEARTVEDKSEGKQGNDFDSVLNRTESLENFTEEDFERDISGPLLYDLTGFNYSTHDMQEQESWRRHLKNNEDRDVDGECLNR